MSGTTLDLLLVAAFLGGMVLLGVLLLVVVLRVGPKRGTWNQPAAALARPGRVTFVGMYALAAAHVLAGIACAVFVPGAGLGVLVVVIAMACFYVVAAHSYSLAMGVTARRHRDA